MDYSKFDKWREGAHGRMRQMLDRLDLARLDDGDTDVDGHKVNENRVQLPEFLVMQNPFLADEGGDPRTGAAGQSLGGMQ